MGKVWSILLVGFLSMTIAEVFAGSSTLWFLDVWGLLITFPLYTFHLLFYLNVAKRTQTFSVWHLYLWGALFGLYEGPITKVLWSGYPGSAEPIGGALILGIAMFEFLTLCLFWHPVMAFVLPILVYEYFCYLNGSIPLDQSHLNAFINDKRNTRFIWLIFTIASIGLTINSQFNVMISLTAALGSFLLIYIAYQLAKRDKKGFSIDKLILGNFGFALVILYLIALYLLMWNFIQPDKIPDESAWVPLIVFLIFIVFLLLTSKKSKRIESNLINGGVEGQIEQMEANKEMITPNQMKKWISYCIVLLILLPLFAQLVLILFVFQILLIIVLGFFLLVKSIKYCYSLN